MSSQLMSAVLLLLRLWESGTREMDNERSTQGTSAPLLPLLQRFQNIHSSKEEPITEEEAEVTVFQRTLNARLRIFSKKKIILKKSSYISFTGCRLSQKTCCAFQILTAPLSPNETFLRYLILPQDNHLAIDLRQTAVVIMAHLDRLASPYSPPNCNSPTSHKVIILLATNYVVISFK